MRFTSSFVLLLLLSSSPLLAQSARDFPASELQEVSAFYTGDKLNWPILVTLADHNIETNTFYLSRADIIQLESLAGVHNEVQSQKDRIEELISAGATLFAKDELLLTESILNEYNLAIKQGNIDEASEKGNTLKPAVDQLSETLTANRMIQVQAQLAHKEGQVDKKLGLLGSWQEAITGDFFKESDGLRTMNESFANLAFVDGSYVVIDPNTVAVIRRSRVDKLDESADTEITLEEGGLFARLSAIGKEKSTYILNAGSAQSELNTQNFYAESDGRETVKLSNYDGQATVSANDITITINKNEGTVVKEGAAPSAPIQLLASPEILWGRRDSVVYKDELLFAFKEVEDARSYIVQTASNASFSENIEEIRSNRASTIIEDLDLGITYVRVLAVDEYGLRGPFSEPVRIIRNEDNQPPPVFIDGLNGSIVFTLSNSVRISGVTEPDINLQADGQRLTVQTTGKFDYTISNFGTEKTITLIATDGSGNTTEKRIRVVKLTDEVAFNFVMNGASGNNLIVVNRPTVTISSTAYPGLEVILSNEGTERKVQTDSRGRWGITMPMRKGQLSVTFRDIKTGESYLTKSFTVEAN